MPTIIKQYSIFIFISIPFILLNAFLQKKIESNTDLTIGYVFTFATLSIFVVKYITDKLFFNNKEHNDFFLKYLATSIVTTIFAFFLEKILITFYSDIFIVSFISLFLGYSLKFFLDFYFVFKGCCRVVS